MIKVIAFIITVLASTALMAQPVPEVVQKAFSEEYPQATEVEWEQEDGHYEAEFEVNGEPYRATYDEFGSRMLTAVIVNYDALPEKIQEFLDKYYPDMMVVKSEEVEDMEKGFFYLIIFDLDGRESVVMFDEEGEPIK